VVANYHPEPMAATLDRLSAPDLRQVVDVYRDALRAHQEELNLLNVYPVPDGDTGTNMALTLESVCGELDSAEGMTEVCHAIAHGSLMGARGNSGVILSQILRGLADTFAPLEAATGPELVVGLRRAADAAYQAVLRPVEGTILTVVRRSAEAAETASGNGDSSLAGILEDVSTAARDAVASTPELLPVLAEAGVVDAGGQGFTLLIDAFLNVVDGRAVPEPQVVAAPASVAAHMAGGDPSSLRYEVMYLLDAPDETISGLKETWSSIGDSIVVVGGEGVWNCHVHTNDIGAAIEAGIEAGKPNKIRVTDLVEQVEEEQWVREHAGGTLGSYSAPETERLTTGVVAAAVGEGLARMLTSMGVNDVIAGGQSMNPSTAQIKEAVDRCPSDAVIVLPNNKNIVPVAQQVDALTDAQVEIVATNSVVEALAALVAYDPRAEIGVNVGAMTEAAGRVRAGEVTQAVRDSNAECGPIAEGDWIAISEDGIHVAANTAAEAAFALVDKLIDDETELVTVLVGADARPADTARLREHLAFNYPQIEVEVHEGDQPLYPYLIGVE
jgi:DAK2 domain fusion protein YloV